ncbi:PREDICTED: uncharacterized protein LOC109583152 [Amphimedon queenslandica]|uniref:Fibronectin type-III domain-containing protein n=2 Tax=Amphimedon queenslandica TaxID=400682 RepID=A0AAN0JB49_AMPQE|nr:PREDICTED: uncharacterized protein LOC109583152 [Amphimedon queenslandica]|eukprot:XP_019853923.1 PREDICTED: uncharacterized protein LOC109583152 [Amphimedon queenslandica]
MMNLFFVALRLLAVLSLLLQLTCCAANFTNITVQPVSINTTLNSTVVFSCEAEGAHELNFRVNDTQATHNSFTESGFNVTTTTSNNTMRAKLQATAYEDNNNTNVTCIAHHDDNDTPIHSNVATLIIQGLLDSVSDLDYTFINGSSVLLTWTAPYTLDNVPITGYYIVNGSVKITTPNNNTNITLSTTNPDPCVLNNVSVSPINGVGIGSSNSIIFYHESVPLITPPVSVVPTVIDGQQISLNIKINVSMMCKGEYPNMITIIIDNTVKKSNNILTQVNDQLMITEVMTVPDSLSTFIVNVSLSNNGGDFLYIPSFGFGFLGPVTNIDSLIDNCSTINITWTTPAVDDRVSIHYHMLRIYDAITSSLIKSVSVYDTSYQFVDNNLFIHRYTYVITGVNELGEGISINDTFSYQRVPRSVTRAHLYITAFNETSANASFSIPVIIECTGEAPENATITIQCIEIGVVYDDIELVEYSQPKNIAGSVPILLNQQCNISIVFSNEAGSSEPFMLAFNTTLPVDPTPSPTGTDRTATSSPIISILEIEVIGGAIAVVLVLIGLIIFIIIVMFYKRHKKKAKKNSNSTHASPSSTSHTEGEEHQHQHTNTRTMTLTELKENHEGFIGDNEIGDGTTYSKTETTDNAVSIDDAAPVKDTLEGSEVTPKQLNNEKQHEEASKRVATTGGATDLGIAPTKPVSQDQSVQYAGIDSVAPKSKVPQLQSSD